MARSVEALADPIPLVGLAIQAHPSRQAHAEQLASQLNAPIAWSEQRRDVWATHARARRLAPAAEWNLVIQDDAVLGHDFMPRLEHLLLATQHSIVSLFYRDKTRPAYRSMTAAAAAGLTQGGFEWPVIPSGVAIAIRSELVPDMLTFGERFRERPDRDDPRIRAWALARNHMIWFPLPSLVDHRHDGHSLVGNGANWRRTARWFE